MSSLCGRESSQSAVGCFRDVWVRSFPGPEQSLLWKEARQPPCSSSALLYARDLSGSRDAMLAALVVGELHTGNCSRGARNSHKLHSSESGGSKPVRHRFLLLRAFPAAEDALPALEGSVQASVAPSFHSVGPRSPVSQCF